MNASDLRVTTTAMIDVSEIRMIKVITETGSINRAAVILHMSQSTLSKKLSRLEQKMNLALFIRNSSGMIPTQAANVLLMEGKDIESRLVNVERQLALMANKVGGQIRIGVGPIVEQLIIPHFLLDYAKQDHQFRVLIKTESPKVLIEQLETSKLDMVIGPFNPIEIGEHYTPVLTKSEQLVAIVRAGHPLINKQPICHDDLKAYRFISPHMPRKMNTDILDFQRLAEVNPHIVCDNYAMAKNIISQSDYITIGPESLFQDEIARGELQKLILPTSIQWRCHCLAKPETLATPAVNEVVKIFAKYMKTIN